MPDMTLSYAEMVSLVRSSVATLLAVTVWVGQRKLQREQIELQRAQSALAKRQLEMIEQQEQSKRKARVAMTLTGGAERHTFKFVLTNIGEADARDVTFQLLLSVGGKDPILQEEYSKIPIKRLSPAQSVSLTAC